MFLNRIIKKDLYIAKEKTYIGCKGPKGYTPCSTNTTCDLFMRKLFNKCQIFVDLFAHWCGKYRL